MTRKPTLTCAQSVKSQLDLENPASLSDFADVNIVNSVSFYTGVNIIIIMHFRVFLLELCTLLTNNCIKSVLQNTFFHVRDA